MADGFIVRRGGKAEVIERAETPTINFVSSTTTSITFTIKNNDAQSAVILWEQDDTTPDANSLELAAGVTSSNLTISGLTEGDLLTIYATANVTNKIKSNVAELERGTTLATPTITQVSKTETSITFTVRNESNQATDVTYGLTSPPTTTTLALAANTTSTNQTISGLDEGTQYTVFAQAKKANHTDSAIAESTVTTDEPQFFLSFDGVDDYVEVPTDSSLITNNNFTYELWVRTHVIENTTKWFFLNGRNDSIDTDFIRFLLFRSGLNNGWSVGINKGGTFAGVDQGVNPSANQWYHLALTYNGTTLTFYIDGSSVGTSTAVSGSLSLPTNQDLFIGQRSGGSGFFDGDIDEVRIWDVVRTAQQIDDNYDVSLTGNESGLVSYWKFNEGSGTTAIDSAGSNDGTIVGATYTAGSSF